MAKAIMIQGTMSSAGKSYIVTGLCRYYSRLGLRVSPFKSQNMALNSYITKDGLEIGRAQAVQAFACGIEPNVYMNPVLLKPTCDIGSQVIVLGKSIGNMRAREYFAYKKELIPDIINAYEELNKSNDLIIVEGAGSPAEINLKDGDIVNMGLAKLLDLPVLLVGDIDPGGVFAQLVGTLNLLEEEERDRIKGLIINKFRGDAGLFKNGINMLEEKTGKKLLGLVPMTNAEIEEEDSITSAFENGKKSDTKIDIAVIRLPRISNFTDFDALKIIEGVNVRYVTRPSQMLSPDMIVIPGSKNTISDLDFLKASGLFDVIKGMSKEIPVFGICAGFQMLGQFIEDPHQVEGGGQSEGLGLIPMTTVLHEEKTTCQTSKVIDNEKGFFSFLNGKSANGYEVHNGISKCSPIDYNPLVSGSYIHGLFDSKEISRAFIEALLQRKGKSFAGDLRINDYHDYRMKQYDILADSLAESIDFDMLNKIIGL